MFDKIRSTFYYLLNPYSVDYYKDYKNIPNKDIYVKQKLEEWKLDLFSANPHLDNIPNKRILEKKEELYKEYNNKYNEKEK